MRKRVVSIIPGESARRSRFTATDGIVDVSALAESAEGLRAALLDTSAPGRRSL